MNIDEIGNKLVSCKGCQGIRNEPENGIIPRCLIQEERDGDKKSIVVGLNPGKCKSNEKQFYTKRDCSYQSIKDFFNKTKLKNIKYFKNTRDLLNLLGYDGDILWTDLAKCECRGKNGTLPVQTLRVCINTFLREEINIFNAHVIFALGNVAFDFCALSFPKHFVVGIPHPSGSYGNFYQLRAKVMKKPKYYRRILENQKDSKGNRIAVQLSKI